MVFSLTKHLHDCIKQKKKTNYNDVNKKRKHNNSNNIFKYEDVNNWEIQFTWCQNEKERKKIELTRVAKIL